VFWADVSKPEVAKAEFISIAKLLGKEVSSVEEACVLLSNAKKLCLLILDNADDPEFDYNVYLPSKMQGSVIITSRVADCKQYSTVLWEALTSLDPGDSRVLLFKAARIPEKHWEANAEAAESIVRLLGSHTLALIQAGAYIARRHANLQDYPEKFQQQRRRLLEFRPSQAKPRYSDVYATFEASIEVLSRDALQLLSILSMFHQSSLSMTIFEKAWVGSKEAARKTPKSNPDIGDISSWEVSQLYLFADMSGNETGLDVLNEWHVSQLPAFIDVKSHRWDSYQLDEAVYLLESLSLITVAEQNGAREISMHPLAHAWAKDRQEPEAKTKSWITAGSVIALSVRGSASRERVERYLQPHIQSYIDEKIKSNIICGLQRNILALVWTCSWMLVQMRDDARLERLLDELFREAGLDPTQVEPSLVPLYHLRSYSHGVNGHWKTAGDIIEQVVEMRRESLPDTSPNSIAAQHMLACAYEKNGQVTEATELLEHVINIDAKTLPESHPCLLELRHKLASTYLRGGKIQDAIKLFEHVLENRTTLAETHQDRLGSQHELARAYLENEQIEKSIKLFEHVVKIEAITVAETHPDRLVAQHELARAYLKDEKIKEAVELLEHVVKIEAMTLAKTHPDRLVAQHQLARAYLKDEKIKEAVELLEHVVKIKAMMLGETHPDRLASQHELACAYLKDGKIKEAVELLENVVKIEAITVAETHPNRLVSQHELARAYLKDGKIKEAVELLEHVIKIKATSLAETHPDRLVSQHELARAYLKNGQTMESVKLLDHVVKTEATTLAESDPSRIASQKLLRRALKRLPAHRP
jgi:tetratricopeptide (TPR) repeat protein